jgi:hypothetical protein
MKSIIFWDIRRVDCRVSTDVSEEHIASNFRVEEISSAKNQQASRWQAFILLSSCLLAGFCWTSFFDPEDGGDIPPKRWLKLDGLHGVISQRMVLFCPFLFLPQCLLHSCFRRTLTSWCWPRMRFIHMLYSITLIYNGAVTQKPAVIQPRERVACLHLWVYSRQINPSENTNLEQSPLFHLCHSSIVVDAK